MQIFAHIADSLRYRQFARRALIAANGVVTALFGEALAETSKWSGLDPQWPGLRRLRGVLCQLSIRVDVREIHVSMKRGRGSVERSRRM